MIDELDYVSGAVGEINYSEFLAATMDAKSFLKETKLRAVFSIFDTDGNGTISEENLKFAFSKLGFEVPKSEIQETMRKYDIGNDGTIDFEEFMMIFGIGEKQHAQQETIDTDV
jgi:Ca2+-binding EF-hand superfamily protein